MDDLRTATSRMNAQRQNRPNTVRSYRGCPISTAARVFGLHRTEVERVPVSHAMPRLVANETNTVGPIRHNSTKEVDPVGAVKREAANCFQGFRSIRFSLLTLPRVHENHRRGTFPVGAAIYNSTCQQTSHNSRDGAEKSKASSKYCLVRRQYSFLTFDNSGARATRSESRYSIPSLDVESIYNVVHRFRRATKINESIAGSWHSPQKLEDAPT